MTQPVKRALITNDDGIASPGLAPLVEVARAAGYEAVVAAPAEEHSGASAALFGIDARLRVAVEPRRAPGVPDDVECWAVGGSPALVTFLAAHDAFGPRPDVVLSGINWGPNTGHAVLHSGTVGAALAALTFGIRAMAVSSAGHRPRHWETAGVVAAHALRWLEGRPPDEGVLNVNVPDVPPELLRGVRVAPLAPFGVVEARVDRHLGDDGVGELQLGYDGWDLASDTTSDAGLLAAGWATVTTLQAPWAVPTVDFPELDGPPGRG